MNIVLKPEQRELVITREIAAPRAAVFSAWTVPQRAALWWAPGNVTLLSCKMDVRPGGHWHRRMRNAAGELFVKRGTYREVVAPTSSSSPTPPTTNRARSIPRLWSRSPSSNWRRRRRG